MFLPKIIIKLFLFFCIIITINDCTYHSNKIISIDTTYFKNRKIKRITKINYKTHIKDTIEYDSLDGSICFKASFYNDSVDGKVINHKKSICNQVQYFDLGKEILFYKLVVYDDTLNGRRYYRYNNLNSTHYFCGDLITQNNYLIDSLSSFYYIYNKQDTINFKQADYFDLILFNKFYSKNYESFHIKLFITSLINRSKIQFSDTIVKITSNDRTVLHYKANPISKGKNKIRGVIELNLKKSFNDTIIYTQMPVYLDFFVK
jgi:hypothetical protein